jgi:hypothetical protein
MTDITNLFETPISCIKVRNGVYAYTYQNGCVNINGQKFIGYSKKEAIKMWRNKNKK